MDNLEEMEKQETDVEKQDEEEEVDRWREIVQYYLGRLRSTTKLGGRPKSPTLWLCRLTLQ